MCKRQARLKSKCPKVKLFEENVEINVLPYDGTVKYYGVVLTPEECETYYHILRKTIEWKNDEAVVFGKHFITPRKVAWYADSNFSYTYSNTTKEALLWTKELLELKQKTESLAGATFNSCLLNLYHNGNEGMAWHSDGEKVLSKNGTIGSLSFGAERKFSFKHKQTKLTTSLILENGSLLVMSDETQTHWLHRLPPMAKVHSPRINLTFRNMIS